MSEIVVDVQATSTVIGWFTQMWPMIVFTVGSIGGVLRFAVKKHGQLEDKFHQCDKDREVLTNEVSKLKGGHETLLSLLGMQLTTKVDQRGPVK